MAKLTVGRCHHDVRRQSAAKKAKARVLAKAQQIIVEFRIGNNAELLDVTAGSATALARTYAWTNSGVPIGTPTHRMPVTVMTLAEGSRMSNRLARDGSCTSF